MKRLIISIVTAIALLVIPVSGALAAPSENITVTAVPAYIAIANGQTTWTINGLENSGVMEPDTLYYSNPASGGDTTAPSSTIINGECRFAVTNTSTVNIAIVVNFPNPGSGESTNSGVATNGAATFAVHSYTSYATFNAWPANKVVAKITGSDTLLTTASPGDEFWWGLEYESQSGAWTESTTMTSTVTITATASG